MDKRLEKRYQQLVRSHMYTNHELASGIKNQLKSDTAFAQTQAAWRFLNNENCTLMELNKPLLSIAHELCNSECDQYTLVAHDWSHLSYGKHKSKSDTYKTIKNNVGYKLQTSLMLALLAGLWSLLSMDDMLETLGAEKIKSLLAKILGEHSFV